MAGRFLTGAPLALLTAAALMPVVLRRRLPDPVAGHMSAGVPDRATSLTLLVGVTVLVGLVPAALWAGALLAVRVPAMARALVGVALTTYASFVLGFVAAAVIGTNLDAATWHEARTPPWAPWVVGLAPVLGLVGAALLGWRSLRASDASPPRRGHPEPRARSDLSPHTVWVGHAQNITLVHLSRLIALGACAYAVLLAFWPALIVSVLALLGGLFATVLATFDGSRLVLRTGLPWPRWTLNTAEISGASTVAVSPARWSGWGIRFGRGTVAVIARRGPGLRVSRRGRPDVIVTVEDAATGADVISAALASRACGDE